MGMERGRAGGVIPGVERVKEKEKKGKGKKKRKMVKGHPSLLAHSLHCGCYDSTLQGYRDVIFFALKGANQLLRNHYQRRRTCSP